MWVPTGLQLVRKCRDFAASTVRSSQKMMSGAGFANAAFVERIQKTIQKDMAHAFE